MPGPWRTDRVPYLREIMDRFGEQGIEEVVLCCGSQLGKTEAILNVTGYAVAQSPGPMLMVYPTEDQARHIADKRIRKMVAASPALAERYNDRLSQKLELQFAGMYMAFGWANSPAALASKPCRYAMLDEIDKFPSNSGKEADPVSLAEERTKNFWNRKIGKASTPTTEYGAIWQAYRAADGRKEYFVPCPHCGHRQILHFKGIKWPEKATSAEARDIAWFECESCKGIIEDRHKRQMLLDGEWRWAERDEDTGLWNEAPAPKSRVRSVAYHISSIYSPWVSFGQVAAKFLESKDFPELLMNFVNSWLGEPWINKATKFKSDMVMDVAKKSTYERGTVPDGAVFLTIGADYQQDGSIPWVIRAWSEGVTSWGVDYGIAETWTEFEEVLNRTYHSKDGGEFIIWRGLVDSGYRPDDVYQFCTLYSDRIRPSKGSSHQMTTLYTLNAIDKDMGKYAVLKLALVDTTMAKDFIFARLQREPNVKGSWNEPKDIDRMYADQICSEQKVPVARKDGRYIEEYRQVVSNAANHWLDCSVYSYVAAEWAGVRYVKAETPETPMETEAVQTNNWLSSSSSSW